MLLRNDKNGFTLIELLVVIAIIALLMALLMPAMAKVRKQSKAVICQSNLKQWALCFNMYTEDNDNKYHEGYCKSSYANGRARTSHQWMDSLMECYGKVDDIRCCPEAPKKYDVTTAEGGSELRVRGKTFEPWNWKNSYGSYGINGYICNPDGAVYGEDGDYWRTPLVRNSSNIPVLGDSLWGDSWPDDNDEPPPTDGDYVYVTTTTFCINRHNEHVNCLFVDGSARKVGLKELWTLKWHRSCNTQGQWTKAGGVQFEDWPEWMRSFRDY